MNSIKKNLMSLFPSIPFLSIVCWIPGILKYQSRVRTICKQECERYGSTWACPPAVGELSECEKKIPELSESSFLFQRCGGYRIS